MIQTYPEIRDQLNGEDWIEEFFDFISEDVALVNGIETAEALKSKVDKLDTDFKVIRKMVRRRDRIK